MHWDVTLTDGQAIDAVVDLIRDKGLGLRHLIEKRQTLEDTFFQTVGADSDMPSAVPVVHAVEDRP